MITKTFLVRYSTYEASTLTYNLNNGISLPGYPEKWFCRIGIKKYLEQFSVDVLCPIKPNFVGKDADICSSCPYNRRFWKDIFTNVLTDKIQLLLHKNISFSEISQTSTKKTQIRRLYGHAPISKQHDSI